MDRLCALFDAHAPSVYATCLRITRNHHDAEDITQQCFLDLLAIEKRVPGFGARGLHIVALRRAADHVRSELARRKRQTERARTAKTLAPDSALWDQIAPHIDLAIQELPAPLRTPIVMHYFDPLSRAEVARELGVSTRTLARRLNRGLEQLRARLEKKAGITVSVAVLATLLMQNAVEAAPPSLMRNLTKLALYMAAKRSAESIPPTTSQLSTTSAGRDVSLPSHAVARAFRTAAKRWVPFSIGGILAVATILGAWSVDWRKEAPPARPVALASLPLFEVDIPDPTPFLVTKVEEPDKTTAWPQFGEDYGDYYAADPSFVQRDKRQVPPRVGTTGR
jgi:RNA polymerase sigma factor (sigma-70 family)